MTILFWALFFSIIYCYFIYPFIIFLLARLKSAPVRKACIEPTVSIVISLYNEEDVIGAKINNLLEMDYPTEKVEILIGSDGSTDRTHDIVRQFSDKRINLFINPIRRGKMATINELVPRAKNEIIFFTDARQIMDIDAVRKLVTNFADPQIGCASGELIFVTRDGGTSKGVNFYWNYEKFIRCQESRVYSMLGATGAIYAIRKKLFVPGPANIVLDDMYIPFKIIQQGYRAVFDDSTHAYDEAAGDPREEYQRKTRTIYGNYQMFSIFPGMFNPFKSPIAWPLFSHKFLRVIIPFFLIALFFINFMLSFKPVFYFLWKLQIVFYLMALAGHLSRNNNKGLFKFVSKVCCVPYVFCLLNFSAFVGFCRFILAKQQSTWQKARDI